MSIVIEDQTSTLTLSHYQNATDELPSDVKRTRGRIVNDKDEVVCSSFGYTPEYTVGVDSEKYTPLLKNLSECTVYRSEEGSLLRLFMNESRWHGSTHKRIDAFTSRWSSSKTFGEWFMVALEHFFLNGAGKDTLEFENHDELYDRFCATLDPDLVYTFLLRTNEETKMVCTTPIHPTVYFCGAFKNEKHVSNVTLSIPYPLRVSFQSVEEMETYVLSLNPFEYQGVIIMLPDDTTIKITHPVNMKTKLVRGSEPDIRCAYLRIRKNKDDTELFKTIFPKFNIKLIEEQLYYMIKYLHSMYVRRYIKKLYTVVNPVLFNIMRTAHTWHVLDRVNNIVTFEKMMDIMDEEPSYKLFRMLQEFTEQK